MLAHSARYRRLLALRHEVVAVRLHDPLESELPDLGLLLFRDAETGRHTERMSRMCEQIARRLRSDERGYALIDITPAQVSCEFRGTPHPARADARLRTQARYVVDRGVPGPRKA